MQSVWRRYMPREMKITPATPHTASRDKSAAMGRRRSSGRWVSLQWPAWMRDFGSAWASSGSHWVTTSTANSEWERRSTR